MFLSLNQIKLKHLISESSKLLSTDLCLSEANENTVSLLSLARLRNVKSTKQLVNFSRVSLLTIVIFALCENTLFDLGNICKFAQPISNCTTNFFDSYIELWWNRYGVWKKYLPSQYPSHEIFAVLKSVGFKFSLLVWNLGDVFSILLCRFIVIIVSAYTDDVSLLFGKHKYLSQNLCAKQWEKIRESYQKMTNLIEQMVRIIYPLMVCCYWVNMSLLIIKVSHWLCLIQFWLGFSMQKRVLAWQYFCIYPKVYVWLAPNKIGNQQSIAASYFSTFFYTMRISTVTYFAAEVNQAGNNLLKVLQTCPTYSINPTVSS